MTRKYEKPSLTVVMLKQMDMLMTSGPVSATMNGKFTEKNLTREARFRYYDQFFEDE
jgi:hypothetical protein